MNHEISKFKILIKGKVRISLITKVTALIALLIAITAAASTMLIYSLSLQALKDEIRKNLMMLASNAAVSINAEQLKTITSEKDEGNEAYLLIQKQLQDMKKASNGKLRYVYTINKVKGEYIYIVDAAPVNDEENHSTVGEKFIVDDYSYVEKAFYTPVAEKEPTPDTEYGGIIQTGYAPVLDSKGETVGVLAIDMDVSVLAEKEQSIKNARISAWIVAFLLAIISGLIFSRYLTRPIIALTKGTRRIAEGDFNTLVEVNRKDELGELALSFNKMTDDLRLSHEELRKYSLELEYKVVQRTAELSEAHKEIKDILDNISQAIFTIGRDLRFNHEHSRYAEKIFGSMEFAGKNILDVFFIGEEAEHQKANMGDWLTRAFNDSGISWETRKALQPVKEISVNLYTNKGEKLIKYALLDFEPIYEDTDRYGNGKILKLMIIVQDITEKKVLELEMLKKEKEHRDNLNQIIEIIKADKELFEEYILEAKRFLEKFEPQLIQLKEQPDNKDIINNLFRIMHTIKSNSKVFSLERIAGQAHGIENIFASIQKGECTMTEEILTEVFNRLDKFNDAFNETLDIYNKIAKSMSMDNGKTRGSKRVQDESEYLRIKLKQFIELEELISSAEKLLPDKEEGKEARENYSVEKIKKIFKETVVHMNAMRKVEMGRLFTRFPRMVRDISMELGKRVRMELTGENVMVDKNIYEKICDPLVHMVRNSIDHGIEKPYERIMAGKPEEGTIKIDIRLEGSLFRVEISDDGRGLDIDRIKMSAVKKGLIGLDKVNTIVDEEAVSLILQPGFSTNEIATNISGRGIGMDVVRTYVEEDLKGKVIINTEKGKGVKILLEIPLNN